jgi:isoamylase
VAISSATFPPAGRSGTIATATRCALLARRPARSRHFRRALRRIERPVPLGGRKPTASVNYVAAHDGFTLTTRFPNDKHNEANHEGNRDGHAHNLSWNYGVEGPTDDPDIDRAAPERQMRNLLATVLLSQGVPMLLAGDEFGRTQQGNNNGYCQDNELSWVDWSLAGRNAPLVEFVRRLIDLRRSRLWLRRDTFLKGTRRGKDAKDVTWLHPSGREMTETDWNDSNLRAIAVVMNGAPPRSAGRGDLLIVFNADDADIELQVPAPPQVVAWTVLFDTGVADPADVPRRTVNPGESIRVEQRSVVLMEAASA